MRIENWELGIGRAMLPSLREGRRLRRRGGLCFYELPPLKEKKFQLVCVLVLE